MAKEKKAKILGIYGNKVYYGHERSNIQVFNVLNEVGYDLLLLTNRDGIASEAQKVLDLKKIACKGIHFPIWDDMRKPFTFKKIIRYITKVINHNKDFLKAHKKFEPDYIYIANDFMYISLIPSFLLVKTPIIYRLGDAPVTSWKPFRFFWNKVIVKRTTKFVCISKYIRKKLIQAGRDPLAPDTVIYNFPPERIQSFPNPINYSKKGITFSYLGQIIGIKGVAEFIDAAINICSSKNDVYFILAGSLTYDAVFAQSQLKKVTEAGLEKRIMFLGSVENIEDFFSKTDVLVTPSIKEEPLGNVIVEAKSFYTPSIIFNSGGMPELIKHKYNGFVCDESTAADLEKAMQFYLDNTDCITTQSENAFKSINDLGIDFQRYVGNWSEVYD